MQRRLPSSVEHCTVVYYPAVADSTVAVAEAVSLAHYSAAYDDRYATLGIDEGSDRAEPVVDATSQDEKQRWEPSE